MFSNGVFVPKYEFQVLMLAVAPGRGSLWGPGLKKRVRALALDLCSAWQSSLHADPWQSPQYMPRASSLPFAHQFLALAPVICGRTRVNPRNDATTNPANSEHARHIRIFSMEQGRVPRTRASRLMPRWNLTLRPGLPTHPAASHLPHRHTGWVATPSRRH